MIKLSKKIFFFFCILTSVKTLAQPTTNSPYSYAGLGQLSAPILPQNRALGGIAAGMRTLGSYNNINFANPASYSSVKMTTFDAGLYTGFTGLTNGDVTENSFNGSLNHLAFAVPTNKNSAISFGLLPYSTMGYRFRQQSEAAGLDLNKVSSGQGGVSKAYIGYGLQLGKHFSLGANLSYIFGKLEMNEDTEFPNDLTTQSTRNQQVLRIGGLNADYGLQYFTNISKNVRFTLGYAGSISNKINSTSESLTFRYIQSGNQEGISTDTSTVTENSAKITLPLTHRVGFILEKTNKWLIGADLNMGYWSNYQRGTNNPGLNNTMGASVGAQITPDLTSVGSYLKIIDYRFGFKYDKTYLQYRNNDIKQYALTLGLGLPLPSNRTSFYKINIGTELGQRGGLENSMIRERFANIYLGFTLNDKWFQRYKFD